MAVFKASGNVVAAAGVAPFLTINGATGRNVKVKKIIISGLTLTAVQYLRVALGKYSTVHTGGTSTAPTLVPLSSVDTTTAGATVLQYTAAPTPGTLVGAISEVTILGQATTAAAGGLTYTVQFDLDVILYGANENISALFLAAPATAVTLSYDILFEA